MRGVLYIVLTLIGCAGGGAGEGRTSPLSVGRRDDLVTIGAHNEITQVAAGERLVFAATPRGVIVYDPLFRAWLFPLDLEDGAGRIVTALAADPSEDAAWIATRGRIRYERVRFDHGVSAVIVGTPEEIFFDRRDLGAGAYVRDGASFLRVGRTGASAPVPLAGLPPPEERLRTPTARDVFRQYPSLETFLPLVTRGDDLEQWPATAATLAPGRSEVWLGTRGNGLLRVDPMFNRVEPLPFGLLEPAVGALALAADGVWLGGGGAPAVRSGLVFASQDLQRWRWLDGPPSRPFLGRRVNALAIRERTAWVATNRGLLRVDLDDDSRTSLWDAAGGLPSDWATAVVAGPRGTWVGTTLGLAFVDRSPQPVGQMVPVRDLVLWTDTLWIASDAGLQALAVSDSLPHRLSLRDTRLTRPLRALARADSILVAASEDDLIEIDLVAGRVLPPRAASVSAIGRILRLAMDAQTIWLTGDGGVLAIHRATGRSVHLPVGHALPAAATAVALAREFAWIGTNDGLVRIRRRADGMPAP